MVEPHSEADPAALLVQFLIAFGNVAGRNSYFVVEADRHYPNTFVVIVGRTSKGRKGTAYGQIKNINAAIDQGWASRISGGLSSGEGLIYAVRNPTRKNKQIKEKGTGQVIGYQEVIEDHGVEDKRLLVVESEFSSLLKVATRDGNTISPVVRMAWDCGDLSSLTTGRNAPVVKASGAHISLIGHITRDELRRYLTQTEMGNGFANRFLWVCVRRSKILPEGGQAQGLDFNPLITRLRDAVTNSYKGEIKRDSEAREIWAEIYPSLSEGKPGLFGAVISRAEAQVMRLSLIYALLDKSTMICREHLLAALAVWDYCEASAKYIFGNATGDPIADTILNALDSWEDGLTRTEITNLFNRNTPSARITKALEFLQEYGLAHKEIIKTDGRPVENWKLNE